MSQHKKFYRVFSILIFLFSVGTLCYYFMSGYFIEETNSDNVEMTLWGQSFWDSGDLCNPEFSFGHILPFGGQLVFIPLVKLFGVGRLTQRLGMSIVFAVFTVELVFLFITFGWNRESALLSTGTILGLINATRESRQVFWQHVIPYSLSVFYLIPTLIFLVLLLRAIHQHERGKSFIWGSLIFISLALGCGNGRILLLLFAIPVFGALFIDYLLSFSREKEKTPLKVLILVLFAILAGLALQKWVTHNYYSEYLESRSEIAEYNLWHTNLTTLFPGWIRLFATLGFHTTNMLSKEGILLAFGIFMGILTAVGGFAAIFIIPKTGNPAERLFLEFHAVLSFLMLFVSVFGTITVWDEIARRISTVFFSCIVASFIYLKSILADRTAKPFAILLSVLFLAAGLTNNAEVLLHPIDTSQWTGEGTLLQVLSNHNLTYGYTTNFWYGSAITVLSDEQVKSRTVNIRNGELVPYSYNHNKHWFEDQPGQDKYFLAIPENELDENPQFNKGVIETYRATQKGDEIYSDVGYYILVYDHNILNGF